MRGPGVVESEYITQRNQDQDKSRQNWYQISASPSPLIPEKSEKNLLLLIKLSNLFA